MSQKDWGVTSGSPPGTASITVSKESKTNQASASLAATKKNSTQNIIVSSDWNTDGRSQRWIKNTKCRIWQHRDHMMTLGALVSKHHQFRRTSSIQEWLSINRELLNSWVHTQEELLKGCNRKLAQISQSINTRWMQPKNPILRI
jgi:hypothetical protein